MQLANKAGSQQSLIDIWPIYARIMYYIFYKLFGILDETRWPQCIRIISPCAHKSVKKKIEELNNE